MKRRALVAVLATGSLVLAACGGDDDDATSEPAEETTTEATETTMAEESATETTMAEETATETTMAEETATETTMAEETATETTMAEETATEVPEGWPESIVLTLTPSQEAGGLVETAEPLAVALEEALGIDVEAIVPSDYAGVIVALQSGQAQIAGGLGPSQMVQAEDTAGADLILQAVRFGDSQYVTQWFTNDPGTFCADEPVDVPDDDGNSMLFCNGVDAASGPSDGPIGADQLPNVAGNTVAFVDQGSTSGYLIPSLGLLEAGVDPIEDIETLFAGGHDLSVQAVYDGDAQVGVSFNDARGQLVETVPDVGEKVVVFGWSSPIPNDGFAVAGDLPDDLKAAITEALIAYAESEDGAVVMDELYEIDGLVPVPEGSYDIIRELETELSDLLG